MCNESAVQAIINYTEESLFEPEASWPEYEFKQRSYSRWSAYEVLARVMDHPLTPPEVIIGEFIIKMVVCSYATGDKNKIFMFSVAQETAEAILSMFVEV